MLTISGQTVTARNASSQRNDRRGREYRVRLPGEPSERQHHVAERLHLRDAVMKGHDRRGQSGSAGGQRIMNAARIILVLPHCWPWAVGVCTCLAHGHGRRAPAGLRLQRPRAGPEPRLRAGADTDASIANDRGIGGPARTPRTARCSRSSARWWRAIRSSAKPRSTSLLPELLAAAARTRGRTGGAAGAGRAARRAARRSGAPVDHAGSRGGDRVDRLTRERSRNARRARPSPCERWRPLDPAQAIAVADQFGIGRDDGSLEHMVQIWATENPDEAMQWLDNHSRRSAHRATARAHRTGREQRLAALE